MRQDLSNDDRVALARLIVGLLDSWEVAPEDQIALLGLPDGTTPATLRGYYENTPLPDEPGINERVEHLVGIADALRTSWPHNAHMGAIWMNRRHGRFDNRTPLAVLLEDGLPGFFAVRTHLDCAYDWDLSGSKVQT
jgi:hypothetical protein